MALDDLLHRYPKARWHQWEPVSRDNVRRGAALAYGQPVDLLPHVAAADVILALDSDLISGAPGHLRHARDFASRRNPARGAHEPGLCGGAGAVADRRRRRSPVHRRPARR